MVVPYIQGLGEKLKKTCKNRGIQVHFRETNTVKILLMAPKDKDHKLQKSVIIYNYKYPHINCPEQYIGESGRTLGDRLKEHLRVPSPIHQHKSTTGHPISPDCFKIIHREPQGVTRNIKEAMFIRVNDTSLNRNIGKYQLPHIWYQILQDTPTLQLKQCKRTSHNLPICPHGTVSPLTHQPCGRGNNIYFIGKCSLWGSTPKHSHIPLHYCTSPTPLIPPLP